MQINSINFTSSKPVIKRAQDIERRAKNVFPMMSSTYVNDFYIKPSNPIKKERFDELLCCLDDKIINSRLKNRLNFSLFNPYKSYFIKSLKNISTNHAGNCTEHARAALATLLANEYYNSEIMALLLSVEFFSKGEPDKVLYKSDEDLDHRFVLTDMNEKGHSFIVDCWLDFADYAFKGAERYKTIYDEEYINKTIEKAKQNISSEHKIGLDELNDMDMRVYFSSVPEAASLSQSGKRKVGRYLRKQYSGIIVQGNMRR